MAVKNRYTVWYLRKNGSYLEIDVDTEDVRKITKKIKSSDPDFLGIRKIERWKENPDYKADIE